MAAKQLRSPIGRAVDIGEDLEIGHRPAKPEKISYLLLDDPFRVAGAKAQRQGFASIGRLIPDQRNSAAEPNGQQAQGVDHERMNEPQKKDGPQRQQ